jgi:predicted DsbA family dithiol-disulfide isomerase
MSLTPAPLRIDFVSDVACPWCAIGLASFERALGTLPGEGIGVDLHFHPFELNPDLGPEGVPAAAYLKAKYGMDDAQLAAARANLRARGAAVGFTFGEREHVWNTFDAHRLLHWAGLAVAGRPAGVQLALKRRLLVAYHGEGRNPGAREVLVAEAAAVGLPEAEAREVLASGRYGDEVRAAEAHWQQLGIRAVPSVVIERRHLVQGGQPPEAFAAALRQVAAARAAA